MGCNVHLSLNICMFVEQLDAQKRKHAITLHLHLLEKLLKSFL